MPIPTEPIGSIPRPNRLIEAMAAVTTARMSQSDLDGFVDEAVRDTIAAFESTGSPIITDGEQGKPSFATYPIHGMPSLRPDGVVIPFKDGHTRQLPVLTAGPFRYRTYAVTYLARAKTYAHRPLKQAVISASALSLLYPQAGLPGYARESFIEDLLREAETDIRRCLEGGADSVQIDFTEARLSIKLDPSKGLLKAFLDLNNRVLDRFSAPERKRIGVHTCPGGDRDSTHSADVDYAELLPELLQLDVGRFYVQLASEADPLRVLRILQQHARGGRMIFVGVTDPIDSRVETPEVVRARVLAAAKFISPPALGTTDDCGFSPFADDTSTSREIAFAKIRARVLGSAMASTTLGI
jgi:5-methyltetrahydropteroyltriglutamate--homocysteine methyltransferase